MYILKQANPADMWKIHVTPQFFEASTPSPQGHFLKKEKIIFRFGLEEWVYQISGLQCFSVGLGA